MSGDRDRPSESEEEDPEEYLDEETVVTEIENPGECSDGTVVIPEEKYSDDGIREGFLDWVRQEEWLKFTGTGRIDEAYEFLHQLEVSYEGCQCSPAEGVMMAEYSLVGEAKSWWKIAQKYSEHCFGGNIWEQFRGAFLEEYVFRDEGMEPVELDYAEKEVKGNVRGIQGWIEVNGRLAYALFDTGATQSFVDESFTQRSGMTVEELQKAFSVEYADGRKGRVTHGCRGCAVVFGGVCTQIELMVSTVKPQDVIIGMDYLGAYHAHIDCQRREIEFRVPGREAFTFRGERNEE